MTMNLHSAIFSTGSVSAGTRISSTARSPLAVIAGGRPKSTKAAGMQMDMPSLLGGKAALHRGLHLLGETSSGPGGPETGQIISWLACLGAACLLMWTIN